MALFRRFSYKNPPDGLVEISERVYAFDCCFSSDVMGEDEYKVYFDGIVAQLQDHFPDSSSMVFNFREGEQHGQISDMLSQYDMTVTNYPNHYANCPLLPLEMISHFLRSSESWLSQEGQQNVVLMHCDRSSWPVLAFMLSGLLLYTRQYQGEAKTLEMVYNQAPMELLRLSSPLNPQASQLRYLEYISTRGLGSDWPPSETSLLLDCLILRDLPHFQGSQKGSGPILRVYGQDTNRSPLLLFSTPNTSKHTNLYQQEECVLVKFDIECRVQGDVVLECVHLHDDLVREEMVFRVMFHTAFVRDNVLMVQRDEMDILWDAKDHFPKEFKAEVLFSGAADAVVPTITTTALENFDSTSPEELFEVEEIVRDVIDGLDHKRDSVVDTCSDDLEATSVLHSASRPPPPPPPPPFASRRPNSGTMLPPPPPPPPPPFASERPNSGTILLPTFYPSPPPPPPPPLPPRPDFSSSRIANRYYLRFLRDEPYRCVYDPPRKKCSPKPLLDWVKITKAVQGTLWDELQRRGEEQTEPIFDASEIQSIFSVPMPKPQVVRLIDLRRATSMEVLLTKVKMPLPDMVAAVQAMDDTVLDVDQIENLIKFKRFPTEEEVETLKNYTGDKAILGKCEQFLLELMKVPRVEYKLKVFSFKIQFDTQITEFEKRLNAANSACEKVLSSEKLKEIMKHILYLGNTLNQGTPKGSAVGFRLESLLKLSETRVPNSNMTLMHYLCKVLASKAPHLLDFHKDLQSLESASEIKMKSLAEETQAIYIRMEMLGMELYASESDGPVFQVFRQKLKDFITIAETRVAPVLNRYYVVGKDADALVYYFGEDPYLYPVEKVAATLLKFVNLFKKAHEENVKQAYYKGPGAFGSSPPPPPPPPPPPSSYRRKPT